MYNYVMKLSVVVPAYNEKSTLESILARVKEVDFSDTPELPDIEKEIIIIDDCSTDGTTQILQELQKSDPDIVVIFKKTNEGKGFALRDGFRKTTGDYVIVQDADLEYDPNDFKKLLRAVVEDGADVVYGSRFSGTYKDMSNLHYYGNKILTIITNIFLEYCLLIWKPATSSCLESSQGRLRLSRRVLTLNLRLQQRYLNQA